MRTKPPFSLFHRERRGWLRVHEVLVRALVVCVALEFSGIAARMVEVACGADERGECCTDCPVDFGGHGCPPSCPSCHCAHGATALPLACGEKPSMLDARQGAGFRPYEATVLSFAEQRRIYRPPRGSSIA